jgi:hypothetical protein
MQAAVAELSSTSSNPAFMLRQQQELLKKQRMRQRLQQQGAQGLTGDRPFASYQYSGMPLSMGGFSPHANMMYMPQPQAQSPWFTGASSPGSSLGAMSPAVKPLRPRIVASPLSTVQSPPTSLSATTCAPTNPQNIDDK